MGGHAQPQIHAQLLLRRRAGADAQAAVAAPRFIVGDEEPGAAIAVEEGFASALEALTDWGAVPVAIPPVSGLVGHAHAIAIRDDGSFDAGSDPRADGAAATGA